MAARTPKIFLMKKLLPLSLLLFASQALGESKKIADLRKMAEAGDPHVQFSLGFQYEEGEDVGRDFKEAAKWYRKAADQGLATAQFKLAKMYDNGHGVSRDAEQAFAWYRKAAKNGHAFAQNNLGVMYDNGEGVTEDDVNAYAWFNVSAFSGNPKAGRNRDIVAERLNAKQIAAAQSLSKQLANAIEVNKKNQKKRKK
jgi:uncharacterized protein